MKAKFVVIWNNIDVDPLVREYDKYLLGDFQRSEIATHDIKLSELIGLMKMPSCLADWADYDRVVIICNSATATFLLDAHEAIKNAELWAVNWPIKVSSTDNPAKHKFFAEIPEMIKEAKRLKERKAAENVQLERKKCGKCQANLPLTIEWHGPNPILGTLCPACADGLYDKTLIFEGKIELVFTKKRNLEEERVPIDQTARGYQYKFDFSGTKVKINGKNGIVVYTTGSGGDIKFEDGSRDCFSGLSYWDLLEMAKRAGEEIYYGK